MSWKQFESLARRNQLEAILVEKHKQKAETGEDLPIPPLDQLPGEPRLRYKDGSGPERLRSLNALRHGLTSQAVLMPWEDRQTYDDFCRQFLEDLAPVGFEQHQLAQTVADCQWRLNRASAYESAIFYYEAYLAHQGLHDDPAVEAEMSKARVAEPVEKHLLNISIYESRIQRKMMNARKALKELQSEPRPQGAVKPVVPAVAAEVPPAVSAAGAQPSRAEGPVDFVFSDLETFCSPPIVPGSNSPASTKASAQHPPDFLAELKKMPN